MLQLWSTQQRLLLLLSFLCNNHVGFGGKCDNAWSSARGSFRRISSNSKYVIFTGKAFKNASYELPDVWGWEDAKKICKDENLELASITSHKDFDGIKKYVVAQRMCTNTGTQSARTFWLAASDEKKEGVWLDTNKGKEITFQNFYHFEPLNAPKLSDLRIGPNKKELKSTDYGNFAYLKCVNIQNIAMYDGVKDEKFGTICQNLPKDNCFKNSEETKANAVIDDKLEYLGNTKNRNYFFAKSQRSWDAAKVLCDKNSNGKMLDLDPETGFDDEDSDTFYMLLLGWNSKRKISTWAQSFWTSGRFKDFKSDEHFSWDSTGNEFSEEEKEKIGWKFYEDSYLETHKTYDTFGKAKFECVSLALIDTEEFQEGNSDYNLAFVRSVCTLPHLVICYGDSDYNPTGEELKEDQFVPQLDESQDDDKPLIDNESSDSGKDDTDHISE